MNFLAGAAPVVVFAFLLGVAVLALTLVMLLATIAMRLNTLHMERIDTEAETLWRPILLDPDAASASNLPPLQARHLRGFIEVWDEAHEPLLGGTTQRLAGIAHDLDLSRRLNRFLDHTTFHHRVMAVIALGHIKSDESFEKVRAYLDDASPILSLCAARALMQINPERAVPTLVPLIVERAYWSQGVVASILRETEPSIVAAPLTDATLHATSEVAPRLIRFLAGVSPVSAAPIIRATLRSSNDERVLSTCLQSMTDPADLDCVRPLLAHPLWYIRMQAATTLGNLGVAGDEQRLARLLADGQWWVRYRAAGALLKLSFIGIEDVRRIQRAQTDAYARDIIDHVLAEHSIGAVA